MTRLTTTRRDSLNALARVSQQLHAGNISDAAAAKARNKAHRVLKGG